MTTTPCSGLLELDTRGFGFLRQLTSTIARGNADPYVPAGMIMKHNLRSGVVVTGTAARGSGESPEVKEIAGVNGLSPAAWSQARDFTHLTAVSPHEIIRLVGRERNKTMRILELFCPLGKGQRALIASPPKAGKTMLLQELAHAISTNNPDLDLVVLLIDERPEEVTDMRRTIRGEVFASSSDSERGTHVRLAKLVLDYAKRKVETGNHAVLLLDSLTRLGRAFNLHQKGSGRTLSGGVDSRALEIPKKIFGAARTVEDGGSLTIIATALVETNSRMDDLIYQEFKGTGNMELVLDRELASERIFPAIDLKLSGTRREELLFGPGAAQHHTLRRSISKLSPRDAMLEVQRMINQYPTNQQLLAKFP
jgi:transcription termination factor Rho